jgi:hypothetical protein
MTTINERNAAFDAVKAKVRAIIEDEAGMFASTVEGKIVDADVLVISNAALDAAAAVRAKAQAS